MTYVLISSQTGNGVEYMSGANDRVTTLDKLKDNAYLKCIDS